MRFDHWSTAGVESLRDDHLCLRRTAAEPFINGACLAAGVGGADGLTTGSVKPSILAR